MHSKYFKNIKDMVELKEAYKGWCKKLHPDMAGGDIEAFKEMKNEYDEMIKVINARENKSDVYERTAKMYSDIMDVIFNLDIEITIHGTWIWVSGTESQTKAAKEILKSVGFIWNNKRQVWQWHNREEDGKYRKSNLTEAEIGEKYGTIKLKGDSKGNHDKKDKKDNPKKLK